MKRSQPSCEKIPYEDTEESPFIKELNCLELPLKDVEFILGPCNFKKYKLGSRTLYLFGEFHGTLKRAEKMLKNAGATSDNTLLFPSFVHSLAVQNPTKKYDLFFESIAFVPKVREEFLYGESAALNSITEQFRDCIAITRRDDCPYDNLRFHTVDFRRVDRKEYTITELEERILDHLETGRVSKQIQAISNPEIRDKLIRFFLDLLTDDKERLFKAMSGIMDVYAIARILRDFDPSKVKAAKGFRGTAENVIYYAGSHHIDNLDIFLTEYLGLKPEVVVGKSNPRVFNTFCPSYVHVDPSYF